MTILGGLLDIFRTASATEREKGTYFEELIVCYFRNEAAYKDLYTDVWTYAEWAKIQHLDRRDVGIDLVARTNGTGEYHAIQCKLYASSYRVQRKDLDSFFAASGKRPFVHRIIVSTTEHWSEHAEEALRDQQPQVSKIDLHDLEISQIDWSKYAPKTPVRLRAKKKLREHQERALTKTIAGFADADRGKLIMACGTGKTFTSLKISEAQAGLGKRVLFLVPSLSLLSQTLTEWTQESSILLHSFAVCSDSDVGKKRTKDDDRVQTFTHELRYPATTDPRRLAHEMDKRHDSEHMSVVFGTYHSIDVISRAQRDYNLPPFDLVVCDEAHRTTGATFGDEDESAFVKVHHNSYITARKRLYMTATPRIYGESARVVAEKSAITLCSMDDEKLYGRELHVITFSEAVRRGLLVDYKVIVLAIEEAHVNRRLQHLLADTNNQIKVDDAAKIVGCWKALAKHGLSENLVGDEAPMHRAVAFCQVIELSQGKPKHKVSSKSIAGMFQAVVEAYQESEGLDPAARLTCEAEHVDGTMNASEKESRLDWLKAEVSDGTCRILSNVRCLSEGVDVPALDAVLFLSPRKSQVEVVQSVGRVMRNAPGKRRGYVVLPVVIPPDVEPHEALNDNRTYAVVWQVLQALRAHDDRFDAMVNKLDLIGKDTRKMEVIAITDTVPKKAKLGRKGKKSRDAGQGKFTIGESVQRPQTAEQSSLEFEIGEIERAIYAKLVQKVGNRHHWEDWATDVARIAKTHIGRITAILENGDNLNERKAFSAFAHELRDNLNNSITDEEVVEMLAQHLVTKPVFDALFEGYSFAQSNPMSRAMQTVLDVLQEHHLEKESDTLQAFYTSVKERAEGIDSATGKQKIIIELYDKFFRNAFPKMTERLGIVYTPVEIVDFILQSVNHVLEAEFGQNLGSKDVHILDPFTGTGTFITRLLQSGIISPDRLRYKYRHEIHANEIVLLAYYIAAINIEAAYHTIVGGDYSPFEGICLTDTFQLYEKEDLLSALLVDNSGRRKRQKKLDIRVVMGNPPYSSGDKNDTNNKSIKYPSLDQRISDTYVARSSKTVGKSKMYDSYIRAIRWASDRIGNSGVVGFVTNASYLDANTSDGLRKSLAAEFSNIYILHLRGNQRTSGELSRKEGGKIFGSGSRAPIAISILVKNPDSATKGQIVWYDIGDYLSREEKLSNLAALGNITSITREQLWEPVVPNEHGDWFAQRSGDFKDFLPLGNKQKNEERALFSSYSMGVKSNRDDWVYSFSDKALRSRITAMIGFYNGEVARFIAEGKPKDFNVNRDKKKIKWTTDVLSDLEKGRQHQLEEDGFVKALYRPFTKQWLYSNKIWNWSRHLMMKYFPAPEVDNHLICVTGLGSTKGFSAFMIDTLPDLEVISKGQCFPRYIYESAEDGKTVPAGSQELFEVKDSLPVRKHGITDEGLAMFQTAYPSEAITKDDVFFYVYGLLHSPEYKERFADDLTKELPRIPYVREAADFRAFSSAGRQLAEIHTNYDNAQLYPVRMESVGGEPKAKDFRVEKVRYGRGRDGEDRTTLQYNDKITLLDIPVKAYEYIVNGKPALEWVFERQRITLNRDSDITNDANDWANDTMHDPLYPMKLIQRVISVSLKTVEIVNELPALAIQ